ncbi:MAG: threonine synthase [Deltaproteobacteria bacterium]|nr:threonine synthase [Deltaproteobacteria bacterium]
MNYMSTRGQSPARGFRSTVLAGLAEDGGLFIPEHLPRVEHRLSAWAALPYTELCKEILSLFTGDEIPPHVLRELVDKSYLKFTDPAILPVRRVGPVYVAEQFYGPTLAFKDLALQFLGNLFEYLLKETGGHLTVLGATSGDTGSAAIHALRGKERIEVFILHPNGRVTPVQERQMTTVTDPNVHNLALEGSFDDAQAIVKTLFSRPAFREEAQLGAVNSINWVRVMVQTVYFFHGYFRMLAMHPGMKMGDPAWFSVPTGNFGHILAGHMARAMGLPVGRLLLAVNANNNLHSFLTQGEYRKLSTVHTISPSMDIQVASNFERYLFELAGRDSALLRRWLEDFDRTGRLTLPPEALDKMRGEFSSSSVEDEAILETIREVHRDHGYLLDPHTAVGFRAALDHLSQTGEAPVMCMATAHPAKFGEAIQRAVGFPPPVPPAIAQLDHLPARKHVMPANADAVEAFMRQTLAGKTP